MSLVGAGADGTAVADDDNSQDKPEATATAAGSEKTVCVIGAGAAGLCAARHLAADPNFQFRVYEQTGKVGGTWVYTERTRLDENGLPIHSSMYRDLRTNLPARIMNFPDFMEMKAETPGSVTHQEVLDYLKSYADRFHLYQHIQFNVKVECVKLQAVVGEADRWTVRVRNLKTNETSESIYDAVIVCNGHYFDPNVPAIPGIDTFPGTVLHSHVYRVPEVFEGKTIFVLGAASSGIDIGTELARRVPRVYLSHNSPRLTGVLPTNMTQVAGAERIEGSTIFLKDGTSVEADVFLFCTGYHYSYPFLDENCGIRVDENYVSPLYKHLINVEHPTMCLVGVPTIVVPFPMFHVQARYFLALLNGKTALPSREEMLSDASLKTVKRHAHKLMQAQWPYNDSLADAGGFPRLPPFYKAGFEAWAMLRMANLAHFKEASFALAEDGETVRVALPELVE